MDNAEIFTIWLSNNDWDAMPYLYEICIASWQVMNPNRKITIYTNNELHLSFLDRTITNVCKLQTHFPGLYEEACKITSNKAHQSDFIRYSILNNQAGIYLDTDVLCYNSLDEILEIFTKTDKDIMFCLEDDNMICNACIISNGFDTDVFNDILEQYKTRYIKHSYLFNSQKYLWLMKNRYPSSIELALPNETIFKPSWKLEQSEISQLKTVNFQISNGKFENFEGFGHHLYSSVDNWNKMRDYINMNLYEKEPIYYINTLTAYIIDKYIDLMKEADKC